MRPACRSMAECHAHMVLDGADFRAALARHREAPDEGFIRDVLSRYQEAGISYVRDGGDHFNVSVRARELAWEYGVEYRTPVFAIHKNGYYGRMVGRGFDTLAEYRRLVGQVADSKGDFIKVMLGGILDFGEYPRITGGGLEAGWMKEMVHIAHEEGFAVMAHVNGNRSVREALEAGIDSLEHGYGMDEQTIGLLAETGAVWTPTLSPVMNQLGDGRFPDEVLWQYGRDQMEAIRTAVAAGVKLAPGSDAGAYRVPHVKGLLDELRWMVRAMTGEEPFTGKTEGCPDMPEQIQQRLAEGAAEIARRFRR